MVDKHKNLVPKVVDKSQVYKTPNPLKILDLPISFIDHFFKHFYSFFTANKECEMSLWLRSKQAVI